MTIRHMVLFTLSEGVSRDDPRVQAAVAASSALRTSVAGGSDWHIDADICGRAVAADFGGVGDFHDAETLAAFLAHPEHVAAASRWSGLASLTVCDLDLPSG